MNNYFLKGILFLIMSILGYVYHRWWKSDKKKKGLKLFGYDKTVRIVDDWGFIILTALGAFICFFVAFQN
ncbi:hypothetical protein [Flavobacterium sp.]|jgi:hypothetical protein|uniref:hypothetical protein n=1 Tax=Flavobacterium sp. TaxID=239 RepID=UPI0037C0367D